MNWYNRQLKIAMPPRREWTDEELDRIKEMILDGQSLRSIAKIFGVYRGVINALNKKYKWKEFANKVPNRVEKMGEMIKELYLLPPEGQGLSAREVGRRLGISHRSVTDYLIRNGMGEYVRDLFGQYDAPGRREEISNIQKKRWDEIGGLEGFLTSRDTRQEAIGFLNNFIGNQKKIRGQTKQIYLTYNKYMQIINNHTYPDEVQQSQPV
jgi:transposase